ncbi:MAG: RDD family protein [Desulfuromonadaceae bacterium]
MTPIPNENNRGEILFRVCAYALTGLQCTLYVFIFSIIPLLLFEIIPKGITIHSSETGYPFYESVFEIGIVAMLAVPNLLGWFLAFLYPLKKNSQTWGMKMIGLKAVHPSESQLSWKTALKQEGLHSLSCVFVIGL